MDREVYFQELADLFKANQIDITLRDLQKKEWPSGLPSIAEFKDLILSGHFDNKKVPVGYVRRKIRGSIEQD